MYFTQVNYNQIIKAHKIQAHQDDKNNHTNTF